MFIFPRSRKVIIEVRIRGSNIHIDRFTLQARGVNDGGKEETDSQVVELINNDSAKDFSGGES